MEGDTATRIREGQGVASRQCSIIKTQVGLEFSQTSLDTKTFLCHPYVYLLSFFSTTHIHTIGVQQKYKIATHYTLCDPTTRHG